METSSGLTARVLKRREWWKSRQDAEAVDADGCAEHDDEGEDEQTNEAAETTGDDAGVPPPQQQPERASSKTKTKKSIAALTADVKPAAKRQAVGSQDGCSDCGTPARKAVKSAAAASTARLTEVASENVAVGKEATEKGRKRKKNKKKSEKIGSPAKAAAAEDELAAAASKGDASKAEAPPNSAAGPAAAGAGSKGAGRGGGGKRVYVVFVGNLPFDVTKEQLTEHFSVAGNIKTIRIPTAKDTGKPRGFAYIEFGDKRSHRLGLGLHQTELGKRKINVEFTSAGGRCEKRLEHLRQKNKALERFKRLPWS